MKSRFSTTLYLLSSVFLLLLSGCFEKTHSLYHASGEAMGTTWQATMATTSDPDSDLLKLKIDVLLSELNKEMSTYDPESALSIFNSEISTEWSALPVAVIDLIRSAGRISKDTEGAYDVTLGTVVDLWGFGADFQPGDEPDMDTVFEEMNNVGHQLVAVSRNQQQVRKLVPGLKIDLSSIAKGYAVDRVGALLEENGVARYVFELGGEIRTRGRSAEDKPWKIALESPNAETDVANYRSIAVENAHIATSGDYRNYREVSGKRVSHLIDGRSGYPIDHKLASVTVLHGTTEQADAWATAFMVLGPDETLKRAEEIGLAVSLTLRDGDTFVTRNSNAFNAYLVK